MINADTLHKRSDNSILKTIEAIESRLAKKQDGNEVIAILVTNLELLQKELERRRLSI